MNVTDGVDNLLREYTSDNMKPLSRMTHIIHRQNETTDGAYILHKEYTKLHMRRHGATLVNDADNLQMEYNYLCR